VEVTAFEYMINYDDDEVEVLIDEGFSLCNVEIE